MFRLITLLLISSLAYATPEVTYTGGRYYIYNNDVQVGNYFNQLYKAKEAAVNESFKCQCIITIKQPDILVSTSYLVVPEDNKEVHLTWDRPTAREDGSELTPEEIKGYIVEVNGVESDIITGLSYTVVDLPKGIHTFRIKTIDSDDREGNFGETIEKVII